MAPGAYESPWRRCSRATLGGRWRLRSRGTPAGVLDVLGKQPARPRSFSSKSAFPLVEAPGGDPGTDGGLAEPLQGLSAECETDEIIVVAIGGIDVEIHDIGCGQAVAGGAQLLPAFG